MALEDAKLFHKDICAFIVNFISAFNTTDHDRMLWIMYDLGFQTDAIDAVKNLYENATTQVKLPSGVCTGQIPVERGTIQGDTLSPFLFLLYMEPLLRWLHVGGRGNVHTCIPKENELLRMLPTEIQETIHMLFIIMWATGCTRKAWKISNTILIDKNKGDETEASSYHPIGLANTLYKLWTRLITNTLYEYAEQNPYSAPHKLVFANKKTPFTSSKT